MKSPENPGDFLNWDVLDIVKPPEGDRRYTDSPDDECPLIVLGGKRGKAPEEIIGAMIERVRKCLEVQGELSHLGVEKGLNSRLTRAIMEEYPFKPIKNISIN